MLAVQAFGGAARSADSTVAETPVPVVLMRVPEEVLPTSDLRLRLQTALLSPEVAVAKPVSPAVLEEQPVGELEGAESGVRVEPEQVVRQPPEDRPDSPVLVQLPQPLVHQARAATAAQVPTLVEAAAVAATSVEVAVVEK